MKQKEKIIKGRVGKKTHYNTPERSSKINLDPGLPRDRESVTFSKNVSVLWPFY